MNKKIKKKTADKRFAGVVKKGQMFSIPFDIYNYIVFGIGIIVIVIGYYLSSIKPFDSFVSLYIAPVVLLIGYVGIFIFGIFSSKGIFARKSGDSLNNDSK